MRPLPSVVLGKRWGAREAERRVKGFLQCLLPGLEEVKRLEDREGRLWAVSGALSKDTHFSKLGTEKIGRGE